MSDPEPLPARPRALEAGVLATIAAAIVNAVLAGVLLGRAGDIEVPAGVDPAPVSQLITVIAVAGAVYSVVLVVLALLLRSGRPWAGTVLLVLTPLGLLNLLAATTAGIVVLILLAVAVYALLRSDARAWSRAAGARRRA